MLNDYKEKQRLVYEILMNEINNDHLSHAYLFDENNNVESLSIVMSFVKEILCKSLSQKDKNILCKRIDDGNYPEIKIIEPEGLLIKKQQIIDLQQEFSLSAMEGNKRIYIIRDADKMRGETANSMLKFLEEPSNDIIAILMTNNFNNILPTIVSRCQIVRLGTDNLSLYDSDISDIAIDLIKNIKDNGYKAILDIQEILFNKVGVKDREKLLLVFDKMIEIYYDIVKIILKNNNIKNNECISFLNEVASSYSEEEILSKLNYLLQAKDSIKYNVNSLALVDSLIINIGGNYESSWS